MAAASGRSADAAFTFAMDGIWSAGEKICRIGPCEDVGDPTLGGPKLERSGATCRYLARHRNSPGPSNKAGSLSVERATGNQWTECRGSPARPRADRPAVVAREAGDAASSGQSKPIPHRSDRLRNAIHCADTGYERFRSTASCSPSNLCKSEGITACRNHSLLFQSEFSQETSDRCTKIASAVRLLISSFWKML